MTEQATVNAQGKPGPALSLRLLLLTMLAVPCVVAAFPWHEGAGWVILWCSGAAWLVWGATSRGIIDNVWWPAVAAVGRVLGPGLGIGFKLAAAGIGIALLIAAPYVVIAVALVWVVWHLLRR